MPARNASLCGDALKLAGDAPSDAQLLTCFIERRDQTAFAALVRLHGPMVFAVCRRLLRNHHDAEDAFQATFLVLARKSASIMPRDLVGSWLYQVACRTALKARGVAAKRRLREMQVSEMPEPGTPQEPAWLELEPLLDLELRRLPEKYRAPIIFCDLEGKTHKAAAKLLGWPEGTLSFRLNEARKLLARRLAGRGLTLSAVAIGTLLAQHAASAALPVALADSTTAAATAFAAGTWTHSNVVSAKVASLAIGMLKSMLLTNIKLVSVVACGLFLLVAAYAGTAKPALPADKRAIEIADQIEAAWGKLPGMSVKFRQTAEHLEIPTGLTVSYRGTNDEPEGLNEVVFYNSFPGWMPIYHLSKPLSDGTGTRELTFVFEGELYRQSIKSFLKKDEVILSWSWDGKKTYNAMAFPDPLTDPEVLLISDNVTANVQGGMGYGFYFECLACPSSPDTGLQKIYREAFLKETGRAAGTEVDRTYTLVPALKSGRYILAGRASVEGTECLEFHAPGDRIWLDPKLNFAMRRRIWNWLPDLPPQAETRLDDFHEIAPGVWLPHRIKQLQYAVPLPGKPMTDEPGIQIMLELEESRLGPFPESEFQIHPKPGWRVGDSTLLQDAAGKWLKVDYVQGQTPTETRRNVEAGIKLALNPPPINPAQSMNLAEAKPRGAFRWILLVNIAAVLLIAVYLLFRRYAR